MDMLSASQDEVLHPIVVEDPMGHDEEDDLIISTTRRAITRVALVAAETASRFAREDIDHDPMAWMMCPRRIFDGAAAIDACLELNSFVRATMLHGLSLGLDAEPEDIDSLLIDDDFHGEGGAEITASFDYLPQPGSYGREIAIGCEGTRLLVPYRPTPVRRLSRTAACLQPHQAQKATISFTSGKSLAVT